MDDFDPPIGGSRGTAAPVALSRTGWIAAALVPLLLLGAVLAAVVSTGAGLNVEPPAPIEKLSIEQIRLVPDGISALVRNAGPAETTVAQVIVDDAVWEARVEPSNTLGRLRTAKLFIPYPWVKGDAHGIKLITSNGLIFAGEVPIAAPAPEWDAETVGRFALIGFYVGVVPVGLGLLWFPLLRKLGRGGTHFVLALTIGLLVFLWIDTILEGLEFAARLPGAFQGAPLVWLIALLTLGLLLAAGSTRPASAANSPWRVAYLIAVGIGLHNLGEGLAIGAAYAIGEAALGGFLVIGFTLHNITEGVGIAAPLVRERPGIGQFLALAAIAGAPAILGTWIGGFVRSDLLSTVFFAVGAGAIAQVIVEVGRLLTADAHRRGEPAVNWPNLGGLAAGIAIMYLTGLLVKF